MEIIRMVRRLLGYVFYPIGKSPAFFVFMYVLCCLCNRLETPTFSRLGLAELFVDLYVLCVVLACIPWRARRWVKGAIYVVMYATSIVDMYCKVKFGSTLTPTMLLLVGETTGSEAAEFLESYVGWELLRTNLGWVLLILAVHILYNVFMSMVRRHKLRLNMDMKLVHRLAAIVLPLLGLVSIFMIEVGISERTWNKKAFVRLITYDDIGEVEHEMQRPGHSELYLPVYRLAFSLYANNLAARQTRTLIEGIDRVEVDSCAFRCPNIVLVIGESYNRHHSQLYGYNHPTTPRQVSRAEAGELAVFTDVVTPWNLTSYVFKLVLSLYTVGDEGQWCDYPLFPEVFRKAGYRVTFVTNQFLPQARDAIYDFSGGFFLNDPTLSEAQFDVRNASLHAFDDGVLADYDALVDSGLVDIGTAADRNLIILHLMGQHVNYRDRTPQAQKKFTANDYGERKLNRREKWILSDYDNATLYNDSIVDEILRRFEDKDAVVVYMPDHAEECYGGLRVFGRMHNADIDYRLASEEFEIPFWVWCSESFAKARPELAEAIRNARHRPFMTDRMAHFLLGLAGIDTPAYRADCDPLSPEYDEGRPRVLKNTADYDKLREEHEQKSDVCAVSLRQ